MCKQTVKGGSGWESSLRFCGAIGHRSSRNGHITFRNLGGNFDEYLGLSITHLEVIKLNTVETIGKGQEQVEKGEEGQIYDDFGW